MAAHAPPSRPDGEPLWLARLVDAEPRAPLVAPFMAYLLVMPLNEVLPARYHPFGIAVHILIAAWTIRLFRHHYPPLGGLHLGPAVGVGLLAAVLWIAGQHTLDDIELWGHRLGGVLAFDWHPPFMRLRPPEVSAPQDVYGNGILFWTVAMSKTCRAVTVVPIVEELFWRGFILRAFISWDRFDRVPWGRFGWIAFLGSSLLSVLQHPGNWGVSIACWMLFNGLFYWKKSLSCLMVTHAVTNLALYGYLLQSGDWRFW